jgi:photosystem II stability/assembly factor-like uncharacterized protein
LGRGGLVIALLIALAPHRAPAAEWQRTNTPAGPYVACLAIHPTDPNILLAAGNELYRSKDGGDTWTRINLPVIPDRLRSGNVTFSPAKPEFAYCACSGLLLASRDTGKTWELRGRLGDIYNEPIVADPFDADRLYVACSSPAARRERAGILTSTDGGKTFAQGGRVRSWPIRNLRCDPNHNGVLLAQEYSSPHAIILSRDHGQTWTPVAGAAEWKGDGPAWFCLDPGDEKLIYAATYDRTANQTTYWYTYDEGKTWELLFGGDTGIGRRDALSGEAAAVFPPDIDLSLVRDRVLWNVVTTSSDLSIIYYFRENSAGGLIQRSLDGGSTWDVIGEPVSSSPVEYVMGHPRRARTAFCSVGGYCYRTDDLGASWHQIHGEQFGSRITLSVHPLKADTLFAYHRPPVQKPNIIWRSDDGGATWQQIPGDDKGWFRTVLFDPDDELTYHLLYDSSMQTTTDDGRTWSKHRILGRSASEDVRGAPGPEPIAIDWTENLLAHHTYLLTVYRPGTHPHQISAEKPYDDLFAMAVDPRNGAHLAVVSNSGLSVSTDAGLHWQPTAFDSPSAMLWRIAFDPRDSDVLICVALDGRTKAYDLKTHVVSTIADTPLDGTVTCIGTAQDSRAVWAGTLSSGVWVLQPGTEGRGNEGGGR